MEDVDIEEEIKANGDKEMLEKQIDDEVEKNVSKFGNVKMPPKMIKRGRPKGAELTVIGLPRQKKAKTQFSILPFSKLQPKEKDRKILECFVKKIVASLAMNGNRTIQSCDVEKNLNEIPDTVRDTSIGSKIFLHHQLGRLSLI